MGKEYKDYTKDEKFMSRNTPVKVVEVDPVAVIAPDKYGIDKWTTKEGLAQIQKWAEEGYTYTEVAKFIGVSRNTLQRWRDDSFELQAAFDNGFAVSHDLVEKALFKKATGYMIEKTVIDNKGNEHIIQEFVQPDIKAIQYYLNNRCKDRWSGNITHQTNIQVPIILGEENIRK